MGIPMRRQDRKTEDDHAQELLRNGTYGILSTADAQGNPYGVPLSYVYIGRNLYFHGAHEGRKVTNARQNKQASFCVVDGAEPLPERFSMRYRSVIVSGEITEVEGREKREALQGFLRKYSSNYLEEGRRYLEKTEEQTIVLRLEVQELSGKTRS
ncbi:Pyridoxamine 5'-phosphate oxidase [Acididesulfobacillus acetoxydans]|uniref:Pyridoxamine 5'-phosphate oxidase n=2 Tax=Acididesulfobacillus acetoxydans TaxID=1561005 RepID=A0A8S0WWX2_9FIRM|nr:Pyridoxamine 5'-phosphate oxidase [Acididesulfobacillus acetoxydans]CEJ06705.1 Pyridoxamine 5'-phosphate oxidase-related FMN-binding protein [Acididesulfobacillus acetoxydans]